MNPDEIDKYLEEDSIYKEIFIYQLKKIKRNMAAISVDICEQNKKIDSLDKNMNGLKDDMEEIKNMIKFMPGSKMYAIAEEDFTNNAQEVLKKRKL